MLQTLVAWVREYETRNDEYGLSGIGSSMTTSVESNENIGLSRHIQKPNKPLQSMPLRGRMDSSLHFFPSV